MRRLPAFVAAVACAASMPTAALAARTHTAQGTISGRITYVDPGTLTVQTGGRLVGVINAMTASANAIAARDYPYVYGGGHGEAGVASIGIRGPGYNGKRVGYDCSGSVAAVLAGAGLWQPGSGVPNDAGVIRQLLHEKLIAGGAGTAPTEVTLYDDPGVHIFMNINGRFFGTSDGGGGDPKGGPTWLNDGAPDAWSPAYKRYHVLPAVLKNKTTYGQSYTFETSVAYGAEVGDSVHVSYAETKAGSIVASTITYAGQTTVSGTVTAIAANGSTVTIQTSAGQPLTLATSLVGNLIAGLEIGDAIQVTYSTDAAGLLVPHALQVTGGPSPTAPQYPAGGPYPGGPYPGN